MNRGASAVTRALVCGGIFAAAYSCSQAGPSPTDGTGSSSTASSGGGSSSSSSTSSSTDATSTTGMSSSSSSSTATGPGSATTGAGGSSSSSTAQTATSTTATTATTGGEGGSTGAGGSGSGGSGGAATTTTGSAGAGGGSAGKGGAGGAGGGAAGSSAGGAGGGGMVTPMDIVPTLANYYWEGTCAGNSTEAGRDCKLLDDNMQCPNSAPTTPFDMRGAFKHAVHKVGGTAGKKYTINFDIRGVAGGKYYTGGKQRTSTGYTDGTEGNDGWYEGGTPTDSKWNTYEMHVDPPVPGAANVYYLNAYPTASGYDGRHETFVTKFSASFPVLGGGTITLVIHDSNCLGQQNCGQNLDTTCTAPRTVDITGFTAPQGFTQPPKNIVAGAPFYPQWLLFKVTSVTAQ